MPLIPYRLNIVYKIYFFPLRIFLGLIVKIVSFILNLRYAALGFNSSSPSADDLTAPQSRNNRQKQRL
jgi:hypothetical protein